MIATDGTCGTNPGCSMSWHEGYLYTLNGGTMTVASAAAWQEQAREADETGAAPILGFSVGAVTDATGKFAGELRLSCWSRCTGSASIFSQRRTVRSVRFKYDAISFQESSRFASADDAMGGSGSGKALGLYHRHDGQSALTDS